VVVGSVVVKPVVVGPVAVWPVLAESVLVWSGSDSPGTAEPEPAAGGRAPYPLNLTAWPAASWIAAGQVASARTTGPRTPSMAVIVQATVAVPAST